ncbi:hypothetical protein LCGC14_0842850, partial [marine sediment metagenome]
EIPVTTLDDGTNIKVIAGRASDGTEGVITNHFVEPTYLHVFLPAGKQFVHSTEETDNAFIYAVKGQLSIGKNQAPLNLGQLSVLGKGSEVLIKSDKEHASEFLLVSAQPLNEPIARGGPFVMTTREQVEQAFDDYRQGRFA